MRKDGWKSSANSAFVSFGLWCAIGGQLVTSMRRILAVSGPDVVMAVYYWRVVPSLGSAQVLEVVEHVSGQAYLHGLQQRCN
jgi:hypothetical protein